MVKYATNFELVMHAATADVVQLGEDDYGLYDNSRSFRNGFRTPLMARGTKAEIGALLALPSNPKMA